MAIITAQVLQETKSLLNDPSGSIYPDVALLPLVRKSYVELQTKLTAMGYSATKEISLPIILDPGITTLEDGAGLPTDFLLPISLAERDAGSMGSFTPMSEQMWEPDEKQAQSLRYWVWREERIHFVGATSTRDILLKYRKALSPIQDATTPILINNSQIVLAQRAAALASLLIGSNPSRASALMNDLYALNGPWEDFKQTLIHRMQSIPVRRRRTRWRKR